MPRLFSRHEQFLRIFALLEMLSNARQPLDDQSLIAALKDRFGLSKLSARTLHRDCDFLVTCGYRIDHALLPEGRKYGWCLSKEGSGGKPPLKPPLTLLELVAFSVSRDLLRAFKGTILWSGIESLRHRIEGDVSPEMLERLTAAKQVFHVADWGDSVYSARPRLISILSGAIADCREIELEEQTDDGKAVVRLRLQPYQLLIDPPRVQLLGIPVHGAGNGRPKLIALERIGKVTPLDAIFVPRAIDSEAFPDDGFRQAKTA